MNDPFRIKLIGAAGDGIISISDTLMQAASNLGIYSTVYKSVPSSIRTGCTFSLISISLQKITSPVGLSDVIFILRSPIELEAIIQEIAPGGTIVANNSISECDTKSFSRLITEKCFTFHQIPFSSLTKNSASTALLGMLANMLDMPISLITEILESKYSTKGTLPVIFTADLDKGFSWASENLNFASYLSNKSTGQQFTVLDGNQALSQGAIAAGCRFFASYPITPSTSIGDSLSCLLPQHGGIAYQAEDEIAALGAVTGSSFSGVKAMTATSGPGFSLMQELISYLSIAELPAVIIDVMRAGPSTGMPTRHGQEDLMSAIFGGHSEDQRIVMAPASIEDCYHIAIDAFNCAENYACPVIILSDYAFAFTKFTLQENALNPTVDIIIRKMTKTNPPQKTFERYSNDNSTFPELPAPGLSNCTYRITGLEHDQNSFPSENVTDRELQLKRRFKKIDTVTKEFAHMFEWDLEELVPYNADACIAAWGFDVLSVKETISRLRKKKYRIAGFYPKLLFPVCTRELEKLNQYSQTLIIPESNFTGQYASLIKMRSGISSFSLTNTTGQPLIPELLEIQIENIITKKIQHA